MDLKKRIETITGLDDIFKPVRVRKYIQARAMYACYRTIVDKDSNVSVISTPFPSLLATFIYFIFPDIVYKYIN